MSVTLTPNLGGFNESSVISALLAVDQQPITDLQNQVSTLQQQQTEYSGISSSFTSLQSALTTLTDGNLSSGLNLFQSKSVTSSDSSSVTATATNDATIQNFSLSVQSLATPTVATSTSNIGALATSSSPISSLADGNITAGNFTMYINAQAYTISVNPSTDTLGSILQKIQTDIQAASQSVQSGPATSVQPDGTLQINTNGDSISFGASADTSNFVQLTGLNTPTSLGNSFKTSIANSTLNPNAALTDNTSAQLQQAVTAGTVTVGGAQFTIDNTTTLNGLVSQINASSTANVTASFNSTTNTVQLTSKLTGNQAITLGSSSDTSNFLQAINLVSTSTGSNGPTTDSLSSQQLGTNAIFTINGGNPIYSSSNIVPPTVSGVNGVTLSLQNTTTTPAAVNVTQNTGPLVTAINAFISSLNSNLSTISADTANGGILSDDISLQSLGNNLRGLVSNAGSSALGLTTYTSLAQIGINTGDVDPTASSTSNTFSLDTTTFLAALAANPNEVQKLLIGDGTNEGILNTLNDSVTSALDPTNGVFASENNTITSQITNLNSDIANKQEQLSDQQTLLQQQYSQMDQLISGYQQQATAISALGTTTSSSK